MFEQLTQIAQQFGQDTVVKNDAIPNEKNEAVINEASTSIITGLQKMVADGDLSKLGGLFQGDNAKDASNPAVQQLTQQLTGNLSEKLGINSGTAASVASTLIPKIISALVGKAKDSGDSSFEISDIIAAVSGGGDNAGIMDAISKYGGQFGLDQNGDGKVDMSDAMDAVSKKSGGLGGMLGGLFGK